MSREYMIARKLCEGISGFSDFRIDQRDDLGRLCFTLVVGLHGGREKLLSTIFDATPEKFEAEAEKAVADIKRRINANHL